MKFEFSHENYNVSNLARSLEFYDKALGFKEKRRMEGDGYTIVYVGSEESDFELELTELKNHPEKYDLGEGEFHLAVHTNNFIEARELHQEMNCVCYENLIMGVYFIEDPDGYWIEVVPEKD